VLGVTSREPQKLMAAVAVDPGADLAEVRNPSPVIHAGGALVLLLIATALSVYKPRGMTRYGWRRQQGREQRPPGVSIRGSL
jgi:hypothetical protein